MQQRVLVTCTFVLATQQLMGQIAAVTAQASLITDACLKQNFSRTQITPLNHVAQHQPLSTVAASVPACNTATTWHCCQLLRQHRAVAAGKAQVHQRPQHA
jgi:hypothetical protein